MATFFKDSQGKLFAAVSEGAGMPAGCIELKANTEDAAAEKHVPVVRVEHDGHVIHAKVGETEHPMTPEHHIEWIALEADGRLEIHHLTPDMSSQAFFAGNAKHGTVYAYCNLHGLWMKKF